MNCFASICALNTLFNQLSYSLKSSFNVILLGSSSIKLCTRQLEASNVNASGPSFSQVSKGNYLCKQQPGGNLFSDRKGRQTKVSLDVKQNHRKFSYQHLRFSVCAQMTQMTEVILNMKEYNWLIPPLPSTYTEKYPKTAANKSANERNSTHAETNRRKYSQKHNLGDILFVIAFFFIILY